MKGGSVGEMIQKNVYNAFKDSKDFNSGRMFEYFSCNPFPVPLNVKYFLCTSYTLLHWVHKSAYMYPKLAAMQCKFYAPYSFFTYIQIESLLNTWQQCSKISVCHVMCSFAW